MNIFYISIVIVTILLLIAWRFKKAWVRLLCTTFLFFHIVLNATFGMGGLRVQIEQSRAEGKSEQYVAGLIDRNRSIYFSRLAVLVSAGGLFLLGFFAWAEKKKQ